MRRMGRRGDWNSEQTEKILSVWVKSIFSWMPLGRVSPCTPIPTAVCNGREKSDYGEW